MKKYIDIMYKNEDYLFQLGVDDDSPMTLFINTKNNYYSGVGVIYFSDVTLQLFKNDIEAFFNKKLDNVIVKDTDSNEYYLSIIRKSKYILIKGKIGDYINQSLEFFVELLEDEVIDCDEIVDLINNISM